MTEWWGNGFLKCFRKYEVLGELRNRGNYAKGTLWEHLIKIGLWAPRVSVCYSQVEKLTFILIAVGHQGKPKSFL